MDSFQAAADFARSVGVQMTNEWSQDLADFYDGIDHGNPVDLGTKGLKVTRLRLLSDPGFPMWDVSYCYGVLNGQPVRVDLPFHQLPKRNTIGALIEIGQREGIFLKSTGILDRSNWSTLQ